VALLNAHLVVFVATRRQDVPAGCERYISVDGTVPGYALRWDHHLSGERINLEAMPDTIDASAYHGVGTPMADADALASVVAVLLGGKARLAPEARPILESASYWCDHLQAHPDHSQAVNRLGRGLLDAVDERLEGRGRRANPRAFSRLARELAEQVDRGQPLPYSDVWPEQQRRARQIVQARRLTRCGAIALVDLRDAPEIDPAALYAEHDCPVSVHVDVHDDGAPRYTVGVHPHLDRAPSDIRPALIALARAEHAHGPPALSPSYEPGSENWGGRARVFGSPWNYGSRLQPEEVVRIVGQALGLRTG
jgi:hypothetical protein